MNSHGQGLEYTMDMEKLKKLGEEAQGLLNALRIGGLHRRQGKIFSEVQRRKGKD